MLFSLKKITSKILLAFSLIFFTQLLHAQCFEIESILVDACGTPEGENEMVRFKVGSTALNTANMSANFPTAGNSWLGICQNGTTSTAVSTLNSTVIGCGILLEPIGGILPANADVLFITSTAINASANSFANLNDTLYVIFQCPGNTAGHFGNYNSSPGLRTLTISFSSPSGCSDIVTYDRSLLVNQSGGYGGNSGSKDGALANFTANGTVSYSNAGCQAPINPIDITAMNLTASSICPGDSLNLTAITQGTFQSYFWQGSNGSFANSNSISTTYYSSLNDTIPFYLKINGVTACGDTISDSLFISISNLPAAVITEPDTNYICTGSNLTLHATGANPFLWSNGTTADSIIVSTAGIYYVSSSNNCATTSDTVYVTITPQLNITITENDTNNICLGNTITLHANGASSYLWSNGATTDSIIVNNTGMLNVTANSICPSNSDSVYINIIPQITTDIIEPDTVSICTGSSITLHSTGNTTNLWSTGASNIDSIIINTAGYYYVTTNNSCFSDSAFIQVNITPQLNISILEADTNILCQGNTITLHASGASSYIWSTGVISDSITINNTGIYSVTTNSNCPSNSYSVFVDFIPPSIPTITEGNTATLCNGNNLTLHVTGGSNYIWNNNSTLDSIIINTIGTYYVEANNGICPSRYDTINIIEDVLPIANIISDTIFCEDEFLTAFADGIGNFSWSNGSNGSQTNIIFAQQLILTASNNCNISVSDTLIISTKDCNIETSLYAPNTITPNGDGNNDVFKIVGINVETLTAQIYNRWGELLFEWDNINNGWNGTYKNKEVPNGTYIYTAQVRFINGVNQRLTGHITLIK